MNILKVQTEMYCCFSFFWQMYCNCHCKSLLTASSNCPQSNGKMLLVAVPYMNAGHCPASPSRRPPSINSPASAPACVPAPGPAAGRWAAARGPPSPGTPAAGPVAPGPARTGSPGAAGGPARPARRPPCPRNPGGRRGAPQQGGGWRQRGEQAGTQARGMGSQCDMCGWIRVSEYKWEYGAPSHARVQTHTHDVAHTWRHISNIGLSFNIPCMLCPCVLLCQEG